MSGSNKGLWLVLGIGGAAGVAFALVYMFVIAPAGDTETMHADIQAWGDKWATARACLVGDEPASSDGGDAMAIRQILLTGLEGDLLKCESVLETLIFQRVEESSGNMSVESLWDDLDKAVYPLRIGLNRFVKGEARSAEELPNAIDRVDGIYAKLRKAAGMKPVAWPGAAPLAQPPAGSVVVGADGQPVFPMQVRVYGSLLEVKGSNGIVRLPNLKSASARTVRWDLTTAADSTPWGAWRDHEQKDDGTVVAFRVAAGPLDAKGAKTADSTIVATVSPKKATSVSPVFATGSGDVRAVVYQVINDDLDTGMSTEDLVIARSTDGGQTWSEVLRRPRTERTQIYATSGRDRIDITDVTDAGALVWLGLSPATVSGAIEPVELVASDAGPPTAQCVDTGRGWWEVNDKLYTAAPGNPGTEVKGYVVSGTLLCDGDRLVAIAESMGVLTVTLCTPAGCDEGREVTVRDGRWLAATGADRGAVVVFDTGGMLFAWDAKSDESRAVYRLPDHLSLQAAMEWDGAVHVALSGEDQLRLVPLP